MRPLSARILGTDAPVIGKMLDIMSQTVPHGETVMNMAQGQVFWDPPTECVAKVTKSGDTVYNKYGSTSGVPVLRQALRQKLKAENHLESRDLVVTAGANQAFALAVTVLCDEGDEAILFAPYYFNHMMALQMYGVRPIVVPCTDDLLPNPSLLEQHISPKTKLVAVVTPCNPTGMVCPPETLCLIEEICRKHGVWLVCDETYEYFTFDGHTHYSPSGPNVFNIFSFSKSYGMAGWRVGYVAFPPEVSRSRVLDQVLKVQDTVPICASQIGQALALHCLQDAGRSWVQAQVSSLQVQRALVKSALGPLAESVRGTGALYFFVRLPIDGGKNDDWAAARWLVEKHRVLLLPGSAFGAPGFLRLSYANLSQTDSRRACESLALAVNELICNPKAPWLSSP